METKICRTCFLEKTIENFYKRNDCKNHRNSCKECDNKRTKKNKDSNSERTKETAKKYRENNKERAKEYQKNLIINNPNYYKKINKIWYNNNLDKKRQYQKERRLKDPLYKLTKDIRSSIYHAFRNKGYTKKSKAFDILGCTFEELKTYLESKFEIWMNWDNKGNPKDKILEFNKNWDIDHVIPLCSAKSENDLIKLNHYTNLQPLCSKVNREIKKGKY